MIVSPAVLALLLACQPASSGTTNSKDLGTQLQSDSPYPAKPVEAAPPAGLLEWHGWSYLKGQPPVLPRLLNSLGDWDEIRAKATTSASGKVWRMKVLVFTRTESDDRDASGVLREHRQTIESVQLAQIQKALERLKGWVTAKFDGKVTLAVDVQLETEWMRDSLKTGAFGESFIRNYLESRINGGSYEAEDKLFRGPYHSALYVLPGARFGVPVQTSVNETPVCGLSSMPITDDGSPESLDAVLQKCWLLNVESRAKLAGFDSVDVTAPLSPAENAWTVLTSPDEPLPTALLSRIGTKLSLGANAVAPVQVKLSSLPEISASLVADPDRGQVLKVLEAAGYRGGGFCLPVPLDGKPLTAIDKAGTFSFEAKSSSKDPLSLRVDWVGGKHAWISLGVDPKLVEAPKGLAVYNCPFVADGKWQKFSVPLAQAFPEMPSGEIADIVIEPSPNAKLAGKLRPEQIEYEFSDFNFGPEAGSVSKVAVVADAASEDPESRALFAAQAKAASLDLAGLLKDKNELVRLNATAAYITVKDPAVESGLVANSLDLDPAIAATALRALSVLGTDTAISVIRQSVRVGFSDYVKQSAATILAEAGEAKYAGDVSLMMNNRTWNARLAGVEALAKFSTPNAGIMRLAFINGTDPQIKLAVTRHTDPSREEDSRILLWSAVNEPSDLVRAESDIKLIQSPTASNRTEGYKGVHDDSWFVRLYVLDYLAKNPREENRNALRLAVTDRLSRIRAAALKGFTSLEGAVAPDEIANVMDDSYPIVQLALVDLAKKKNLKLPMKTVESMLASGDPRVVTAAKGLGN